MFCGFVMYFFSNVTRYTFFKRVFIFDFINNIEVCKQMRNAFFLSKSCKGGCTYIHLYRERRYEKLAAFYIVIRKKRRIRPPPFFFSVKLSVISDLPGLFLFHVFSFLLVFFFRILHCFCWLYIFCFYIRYHFF